MKSLYLVTPFYPSESEKSESLGWKSMRRFVLEVHSEGVAFSRNFPAGSGCGTMVVVFAALFLRAAANLDDYRLAEEPYFPDGRKPSPTGDWGNVPGRNIETSVYVGLASLDSFLAEFSNISQSPGHPS